MNLVAPKGAAQHNHLFSKPTTEASLLNKSSSLAPALGVTKFMIVTDMLLVRLCCATQSDLVVQQTHLWFPQVTRQ